MCNIEGIGVRRCWLVITYQETALLHLPATVQEGPPLMRRWSRANLTPSLLGGGREVQAMSFANWRLFDTSSLLSGGWEVQTMYFYKLLLILTVVLTFINYNQLLNITINLFWLYDSTCILSRTQNSTPSSGRQLLVTKQVWNSRNLKYSQFIDQIKVTSQWALSNLICCFQIGPVELSWFAGDNNALAPSPCCSWKTNIREVQF